MKPGDRYTVGRQPCQSLKRGEGSLPGVNNVHQCPTCWGNRTWCDNCYCDHHDGGWETCTPGAYKEEESAYCPNCSEPELEFGNCKYCGWPDAPNT